MLAISPGLPEPLGVTPRDGGINIAVVSRDATRIWLCLFDAAGEIETHGFALPGRYGDVHCGFIAGIAPGARYALRTEGPWDPASVQRFDPEKLLVDPYARAIDRPFAKGQVPKAIVTEDFPPAERPPPRAPRFIYELAVKAFSKLNPKIPEPLRGTVAALAHPAAIDHLLRLGVDTVELMPIAAWTDERHLPPLGLSNAWGYNPVVFMAPDPRLAPGGMAEVRRTVETLHVAGLRVVLDVVYNHTGESDELGETLSLRGLDDAVYYRHAEGRLVNDTGCGNTLAVERPPVLRLVMDSLRHWVTQAGIDGFRFDLAAALGRNPRDFTPDAPLLAAIAQDPLLRDLTLIAEPWDVGPGGYRLGGFHYPWREWNDRYRDDVRRFWRGDIGTRGALATRLAGSSDLFPHPLSGINYLAAHDGFSLRDAVSFDAKRNQANGENNRDGSDHEVSWIAPDDARRDLVKAMLLTLFASRGIPMLTAGDEFGRSQRGNNNAYAQDNETTWLDWAKADDDLIAFVTALAPLRRRAIFLRDGLLTGKPIDDEGIADALWLDPGGTPIAAASWNDRDARILGLALYAEGDRVCLWINGSGSETEVESPAPRDGFIWELLVESAPCAFDGIELRLAPRSAVLLGEKPDPAMRRGGVDDRTVSALAELAGIAPEWFDIDGVRTETSIGTKRALLAAMGIAAETAADARASLQSLRRETPRTFVAHSGEKLDLGAAGRRDLSLELETGEALALRSGFDGSLRLPDLPMGVHRLIAGDDIRHIIVAPDACHLPPEIGEDRRSFGLAAHLYALRRKGDAGIGDFETLGRFGEAARALDAALIGINPLHHLFPTQRDRASPYQPSDRRFIDPIYLAIDGLADPRLAALPYVDYAAVWAIKRKALRFSFDRERDDAGFAAFQRKAPQSLRRHALFECLAEANGGTDWKRWTKSEGDIDPGDIAFRFWLEWKARAQLAAASRRGDLPLGLYRDLALGCAPDGGEVWAAPERFATGVSIGAPPDPFSRDGQVWALPPFNPRELLRAGLAPMREILAANMLSARVLRIDHVLGYARQFWVPEGAPGRDGAYVRFPLDELIAVTALESHRAQCAVIGEDLGTVPPGLRTALRAANILSYKVLWFEKEADRFRPIATYPPLSASCLSSHDLLPFLAWMRANPVEEAELRAALAEVGIAAGTSGEELMAAAHAFLALSPSVLMLAQVDDLTAETEPLNVPGTDRERPNWRRRVSRPIEELPDLALAQRVVAAIRRYR